MNELPVGFQAVLIYLYAGILFGIFFIVFGASRLDQEVKGAGWKFRLLILPGTILLWPYLLLKLIKKRT